MLLSDSIDVLPPPPWWLGFQANKCLNTSQISLMLPSERDFVYEPVERVYGDAVDSTASQMIYQR